MSHSHAYLPPVLPLTPAAFTVEVLNSAANDLVRLWRLEARIDTYLSVVSPARTRPQLSPPVPLTTHDDQSSELTSPPPTTTDATFVVVTDDMPRTRSGSRAKGVRRSAASTNKARTKSAASAAAPSAAPPSSASSASSLSSLTSSAADHAQAVASAGLDTDLNLDFECHIETLERLPAPIAAALTLGSTPRGADMDKVKLYGILAVSYMATSALFKVVQPFVSVQEYFAQRFLLSRTQLARILNAAQVILDLSATLRDPVDLVPFPLSLDVAGAVCKCAGPSRRARRALWSAVLLTSTTTTTSSTTDEHTLSASLITRADVDRALELVRADGIQYYLDAATPVGGATSPCADWADPALLDTINPATATSSESRTADENNHPHFKNRSVKGVRYRDLELSSTVSTSHRFHPYARRASGQTAAATSNKAEYMTPPDTPANALLHGGATAASLDEQPAAETASTTRKCSVPGAAATDDVDPMDVDEDAEPVAEDTSSIMSPPTSPAAGTLSKAEDHPFDSALFGGSATAPKDPSSVSTFLPGSPRSSRQRGGSAVSIDLLVAAADFVEQQERRTSVSSTGTSAPPLSPMVLQFPLLPVPRRGIRGPPKYPIEFETVPLSAASLESGSPKPSTGRAKSPLSLEFSTPAAKDMMPSPSPSPVQSKKLDLANVLAAVSRAKTPEPGLGGARSSSVPLVSSPPRPTSSSLFGVIATSSSPCPVAMDRSVSLPVSPLASRPMHGGLVDDCEA